MVTIRPVRREDVRPLIALTVAPEDATFVAPNAVTLAEAPYETGAHVFAIWADDRLVGLAALVDNRDYSYLEPDDDPNSAFLWRLMVGSDHQRQGIGHAAMHQVFDWARARALPRLFTSVVAGNTAASRFYESLGFALTGRDIDGEAEMLRHL